MQKNRELFPTTFGKMRKFNLTILIVLGVALINSAQSQVLIGLLFGEKLNKGPIEFGVNIFNNTSMTSLNNSAQYRNKLGFGLYLDYKFSDRVKLAGSFCFASPKGEKNFDNSDPLFDLIDSVFTRSSTERTFNYLDLPMMLIIEPFKHFGIGVGGYVSLMTRAFDYYELVSNDNDRLVYEHSIISEMNRFDYGIMGGLSYHFKGDPGSQIRINYLHGLSDLFKDSKISGVNETIQVGFLIPIKFGLKSSSEE